MNGILSTIGACSIVILIFYVISKVDEYFKLKSERKKKYKIDQDDDE